MGDTLVSNTVKCACGAEAKCTNSSSVGPTTDETGYRWVSDTMDTAWICPECFKDVVAAYKVIYDRTKLRYLVNPLVRKDVLEEDNGQTD